MMDRLEYFYQLASDIADKHDMHRADDFLNNQPDILSFGVESFSFDANGIPRDKIEHPVYLNSGDTYHITVIKDSDGYHVTTLGDWIQEKEKELYEEYSLFRCGYCSSFTENENGFHDTVCDYCDNQVAG